jgi:hypothetical protein
MERKETFMFKWIKITLTPDEKYKLAKYSYKVRANTYVLQLEDKSVWIVFGEIKVSPRGTVTYHDADEVTDDEFYYDEKLDIWRYDGDVSKNHFDVLSLGKNGSIRCTSNCNLKKRLLDYREEERRKVEERKANCHYKEEQKND